jgi:hypothetical protein
MISVVAAWHRARFVAETAGRLVVSAPRLAREARTTKALDEVELKYVGSAFPIGDELLEVYRAQMRNRTDAFELPDAPAVLVSAVTLFAEPRWLHPYNELTVAVRVRYRHNEYWYPLVLFLDNWLGVVAGKRQWGYPKHFVEQDYRWGSGPTLLEARVPRSSVPYLVVRMHDDPSVEPDEMVVRSAAAQDGITVRRGKIIDAGAATADSDRRGELLDGRAGRLDVEIGFVGNTMHHVGFGTDWVQLLAAMPRDNPAIYAHHRRSGFAMRAPEVLGSSD